PALPASRVAEKAEGGAGVVDQQQVEEAGYDGLRVSVGQQAVAEVLAQLIERDHQGAYRQQPGGTLRGNGLAPAKETHGRPSAASSRKKARAASTSSRICRRMLSRSGNFSSSRSLRRK